MKLQSLLEVSESSDLQTFQHRLHTLTSELDFEKFNATVVLDRIGQESRFISAGGNVPKSFTEALDPKLSRRDPVLTRLKCASTPITYTRATYLANGASDLWDIQAAHGYLTGVSVALHLPHGCHFILGIDRVAPLPRQEEKLTALMANVQLLASYAQSAAMHLVAPLNETDCRGSKSESNGSLSAFDQTARPTKRELEVLRWTLAGKTAWEVGMILNISERTAAIHANRATHKLDCVSKHQAALKAMRLGLI